MTEPYPLRSAESGDAYQGLRMSEDDVARKYGEWAQEAPPSDASGFLYKKAGGHPGMSLSPRHNWSRRWFRLEGKSLMYGKERKVEEDEDDMSDTVWTGDLVHAKAPPPRALASLLRLVIAVPLHCTALYYCSA
jgi:hypothetical protein